MSCIRNRAFQRTLPLAGLILFAAAGLAAAQDQQTGPPQTQNPAASGWRKFGDPAPAQVAAQDPEPVDRGSEQAQTAPRTDMPPARPAYRPPTYGLPAELTVRPGTFVTVRVNDMLSSNHNQAGDPFSAVLMQPLVVDGVVVAQRGQTVYGRVAEARKSHADTPSSLALELTGLTLVDGTQATVRSQLVARQGGRAPAGQQAGTVIGTTVLGAGIGAMADWGTGAAIGAGVGATVGTVAALLTRNHPTVVYPETALTFRIDEPLTISTAHAPQAFRYVDPNEYNRPAPLQARTGPPAARYYNYAPYWGPQYSPYPYGYWGPYYGPSLGIGIVIGRGGYRHWR